MYFEKYINEHIYIAIVFLYNFVFVFICFLYKHSEVVKHHELPLIMNFDKSIKGIIHFINTII